MVNTENLGSNKSRLHFAIAKAVGPLLHDLGEKLESDAALETLERLSRIPKPQDCASPTELLEHIDAATASTLASDVATAAGIHLIYSDLCSAEADLGHLLSARARSHMNTLEHIPHISTQAAQLLISLESASLRRGPIEKSFSEALSVIKNAWTEKEQRIQNLEKIPLSEFQSFRTDKLERAFSFALQSLTTSCAALQAAAAEGLFPLREVMERTRNPASNMPTLATFEIRGIQHAQLMRSLDSMRSSRALPGARHLIARSQWLKALECVCDGASLLENIVRLMRETEPSPSQDPRLNKYIEGENYLYIQALTRQILILGTAPRDAQKLADSLYEYACKNAVSCSEIIDEEILALNTNIRREVLAKARLEVRLADRSFPLSAAHKEWIVQTTKPFTKE